ncbi:hypothetical protein GGF44_003690 [Coemansia sp. RSA 1694]|nr:hypothetical protein GGF38_002821 [Coemansia sp. RSA 25]KAJ2633528.1 hypothetical protein GGF44_003690 [Coemansia sp. RSA 1694]
MPHIANNIWYILSSQYRILVDNKKAGWIRWNSSESTVEIHSDFTEFREALQCYGFHPQTRQSVKKNFTDYGFAARYDDRSPKPDANGIVWAKWSHSHFKRDDPELLAKMSRRPAKKHGKRKDKKATTN